MAGSGLTKENHYRGEFDDRYTLDIKGFHPQRGFDPSIFDVTQKMGLVATKADVVEARRTACRHQINNPNHDILITICDSRRVPENSRNAPLDGNGGFEYFNHRGHGILHKKRCPEPPSGLYDWEPWTRQERDKMLEEEKAKMYLEKKEERHTIRAEKKAKRRR